MSKVVIVADMFAEEYGGGAELSTQALIEAAPKDVEIIKLKSADVSRQKIDEHVEAFWIFTNFTRMGHYLMPYIVNNLQYVIVEYDYKYCWYRSPDLHKLRMGVDCNCDNPLTEDFYNKAANVVFMSLRQCEWYRARAKMPLDKCFVMGSFFSDETLAKLRELRGNEKTSGNVVLYYESPIKGTDQALNYCRDNNIEFDFIKKLPYAELLTKLSSYRKMIYKPIGGDTCPRVVIEAQMMGLELDLNKFVEHKDEPCYSTVEKIDKHLSKNKHDFWLYAVTVERLYGNHKQKVGI